MTTKNNDNNAIEEILERLKWEAMPKGSGGLGLPHPEALHACLETLLFLKESNIPYDVKIEEMIARTLIVTEVAFVKRR